MARLVFLVACVSAVIPSTSSSLPSQPFTAVRGAAGEPWAFERRLSQYCSHPPFGPQDESTPLAPGYELQHATVLVRHGDRSNIGKVPGARRVQFVCGEPTPTSALRAARELAPFRSTRGCILAGGVGGACENVSGVDLGVAMDNALFSWGRAREEGSPCSNPGELTTRGWKQLRGVGETLGRVYRALITTPPAPFTTPLHVISTDTGRTALSAAALVSGLLDEVLPTHNHLAAAAAAVAAAPPPPAASGTQHTAEPPTPPISTASVTGTGEVVEGGGGNGTGSEASTGSGGIGGTVAPHPPRSLSALLALRAAPVAAAGGGGSPLLLLPGLSLPLPLHILPRDEDPMLWPKKAGVCPSAAVAQEGAEEDIFQHQVLPGEVAQWMEGASGVPVDDLPTTEECADDILTRLCHGHTLPCWNATPPETGAAVGVGAPPPPPTCLPYQLAASIAQRCDVGYAYRFTNDVTRTLTYPLLQQLAEQFAHVGKVRDAAAAGGAASAALDFVLPRLQLRSVHDTVLAPLLAVLGAVEYPYSWPNYASRVSIEVWGWVGGKGHQQQQQQQQQGEEEEGGGGAPQSPPLLLTLLYNGVDFTGKLACAKPVVGAAVGGRYACTLHDFTAQVQALLGPHPTWEAACHTDKPIPLGGVHPPTGKKRSKQAHAPQNDVGVGGGQ